MRTSRKHSADRRKNLSKQAVYQAVHGIEQLESRLLFAATLSSTTILAMPSPDPYASGTPGGVTLEADVSATMGGTTPSGTVTFFTGATQIGPSVTLIAGSAFLTNVTTLPVGSDSITADYSGDSTYIGSNSSPQIETVTGSGTTLVDTTTTVTAPVSTAAVGTNITFTANVAPVSAGGAAVTGTVTFFDGSTSISAAVPVDGSGNATLSTSTLPVGADSITATYSGDSNYNASNSAAFVETITSSSGMTASTTTVSTMSPTTVTSGTSVTFNATVAPSAATGTVQFMSNGSTIGAPQMVIGGLASFTTTTLPVGADLITAVYSGDSTYAASTSPSITETVNPGALTATTTTLNTTTPSITAGGSVTFTATVAPGGATGTVQFFSNGAALGTAQNVVGGVASLTTTALNTAGSDTITAVYSGDSSFASSTATGITETVNPLLAATTTTVTAPATFMLGASVLLTATVAPSTATGTVQFFDGGTALGAPVTLSGGTASLNVASLVVGPHDITASYSGDAGDASSVSATVTITGLQGTAKLTTSSSAPTIALGDSVTFTATVGPQSVGGPAPTGTVSFLDGMTPIGAPVMLSGGVATLLDPSLTVGSHTISFTYSGDINYVAGSSPAIIETVNPGPTVTTVTVAPNPVIYSLPATLTATVSPMAATGTVTFFSGTTQLSGPAGLVGGTATITLSTLPGGADRITAVYSGDPNYAASTSAAFLETVTPAPSTTVLTTSTTSSVFGNPILLTANVPIAGATGLVNFFSGATLLGSGTLAAGVATLSVATPPIGADSITAVYVGDGNFAPSSSLAIVVNVTPGITTTTVTPNPSVIALGAPVTFTITVDSGIVGTPVPTGTLTLTEDGSAVLASSLVLVNGTAFVTTTALSLGVDTIVATYSGDANYLGGGSAPAAVSVSSVTTSTSTTSLTSSAQNLNYGDSVSFTAVVAPALTNFLTPTGTVTFFDGTIPLGAPVPLTNGIATFATASLPPGINNVTAVYNGDANFTASTSAPSTETVTGSTTGVYVTTLDISAFNAAFGSRVTLTATVFPSDPNTPAPFGGTVTFFSGNQTIGAASLALDGTAVFATTLPAGTDEITAAYNNGGPVTASLPRMIAISPPATPSLAKANLPPAIVVGTTRNVSLPILLTNLGGAPLKGLYTVQVYLDQSTTLDGNRQLLTTISRSFALNGHKSRAFHAPETLSSSLTAGTYYFLIDVTDPNGLTNLVASKPIVVAQPFVGLSAVVSATNPPNIGIGQSAVLFVTITNTGNEAASGLLSLTLSPSSDGINPLAGKILGSGAITTTIQPGKSRKYRLVLDTTALANGSYFPYISAALDGVSTTAVGVTPFTVG